MRASNVAAFLVPLSLGCSASPPPPQPVPVELPPPVAAAPTGIPKGIAVGADGVPWVATSKGLFREGRTVPLPAQGGSIQAIAVTPIGPLVVLKRQLFLRKAGSWKKLVDVPLERPRLAAGVEWIYVSGLTGGRYALFAVSLTGRSQHILTLPQPVGALCALPNGVLFTQGGRVLSCVPGQRVMVVAAVPGIERITCLIQARGVLFLCDRRGAYALTGEALTVLSRRPDPWLTCSGANLLVAKRNGNAEVLEGLVDKLAAGDLPKVPLLGER